VRELLRLGFYLTLERKGVKDTESVCVLRDWVSGDLSFHFFLLLLFFFSFYSWVEMRNLYAWRIPSKLINCLLPLR
jgi:hypothetical protein